MGIERFSKDKQKTTFLKVMNAALTSWPPFGSIKKMSTARLFVVASMNATRSAR